MGTFSVPMSIGDPQGENWIEMDALVGASASVTSVPGSLLRELAVAPVSSQQFRFAQCEQRRMDMGRTWISVKGREEVAFAVFNDEGTSPLLGALALETLFLDVDPVEQKPIPVDGYMMSPVFWWTDASDSLIRKCRKLG